MIGSLPWLKPDWSPDYFEEFDYIGLPIWFRADCVKGLDLNDDFSTLKKSLLMSMPSNSIDHIPLPLIDDRGCISPYSKIEPVPGVADEIPLFSTYPKVSIIIPTRDGLDYLSTCISTLASKTHWPEYELIVVDNQSSDPDCLEYLNEIAKDPCIQVIPYDEPFNFSALNNYATEYAEGEYLLFLNNDIEVIQDEWLEQMMKHAVREGVGCVGSKLYYPDMRVQHAGVVIGFGGGADHAFKLCQPDENGYMNRLVTTQNYSAVTGACLLVKKQIFNGISGFNEDLAVAFNDIDFCLKVMKAGYRNVWTPHARLIHHESVSRGHDFTPEKAKRFNEELNYLQSVWHTENWHDPAYNPHLSLCRHDFAVGKERSMLDL